MSNIIELCPTHFSKEGEKFSLPPGYGPGRESWFMTERILTQVQAPEMGFLRRLHGVAQGRTEFRWCPGKETSLAHPCSNLRSFRSKFTVLKKKLVTLPGLCRRPPNDSALGAVPPSLRPWCCSL